MTMTEPYPAPATSVLRTEAPTTHALTSSTPHPGGSGGPNVTPEKPRRHPIAYAALALGIISLIWLAILTSKVGDEGYQKVRVGTQDCVSVPQDSGPAALYCRTSSTG